jgi:hypothetical protein
VALLAPGEVHLRQFQIPRTGKHPNLQNNKGTVSQESAFLVVIISLMDFISIRTDTFAYFALCTGTDIL